jgi:hypothetical protein
MSCLFCLQVFDHLNQRNERLTALISNLGQKESKGEADAEKKDPKDETSATKEGGEEGCQENGPPSQGDPAKGVATSGTGSAGDDSKADISAEIVELNRRLQTENANLHSLNTSLHERSHFAQLRYAQFEERLAAEETRKEELQNKVDDLEYELTKCRMRNGKLETTLAETQEKLKMYVDRDGGVVDRKVVLTNAERKSVEQLNNDLEEQKELASNRLLELEKMNSLYKESLKEVSDAA